MKKTLTRAGAIGMAAATILTGLSFGPAAASASNSSTETSDADVFHFVGKPDNAAWYYGTRSPGAWGQITGFSTREAAEAQARPLELVPAGAGFIIRDIQSQGCLVNQNNRINISSPSACDTDTALFESDSNGHIQHLASGRFVGGPVRHDSYTSFSLTTSPQSALQFEGVAPAFNGHVVAVDVAERSVRIAGRAKPGAAVVINGEDEVVADDTGAWSANVTGLTLGKNTITLEQYEGTDKTDETTVEVDLAVQPVVATTTFPTDRSQNAVTSGTAHPGADVVITDAAGTEIGRTTASTTDGTWSIEIPAPNVGGDYPVTIHQEIDGDVDGEITETIAYGSGIDITMPVEDMAHDGGPVSMEGTGEPGARITVREQGHSTVIGDATVLVNGIWTLRTKNVDTRKHVLEATQTGKGNNVTTSTVTLNPEAGAVAPVTVETPEDRSTVTTSRPTFTGHGQDGATVTIGYGANSIIGTAVVENGEWTIAPTRGLSMGVSNLIVTQTIDDDVQTIRHTLTRVAVELPLAVTSHVNDQTYAEGVTTFRGTAPVGSAIRATNQWGTVMGTATATDGTWSFDRNLGPTTAGYDLTFVATPPVGDPQTVSLKLNYAGVLAFEVTSPKNNSTYTVGTTTFTGTAVPNAVITATNQWGTPMGRATAGLDTTWAFDRYLGPTSAGYDITFVATKGTDTQRTALHLNTAVVNQPVAVTSHTDGATYRPGLNVLTGTGTPGATVEAVNATNGWNVPMGRATVDSNGAWALPERNWGPSNDYAIQVTQTNPDKTTSTTTVNVKAPVFAPLVLTSPQVGDTYDTGVAARFEGTATPFAEITVRSAKSTAVYRTVEADVNGNWSFDRVWGPTHDYVLTIDQKAKNGQSDSITGFAWNHSGN